MTTRQWTVIDVATPDNLDELAVGPDATVVATVEDVSPLSEIQGGATIRIEYV
jgi:hypothetical protein